MRDGVIVEVRGPDGSPPYLVSWSDTGGTCLMFPEPDAHLTHDGEPAEPAAARHVRSWRVTIDLVESGDQTTAHAILLAETPERLDASGQAHRNPADPPMPEIGDEVAVARALRRLSDRLLEVASADISAVKGTPATLRQ